MLVSRAANKGTARLPRWEAHHSTIRKILPVFFVASSCGTEGSRSSAALSGAAALWLLGAGMVTAALAALAGLTDFIGDARIRQLSDA
jgi:hypothetical protein